MMSGPIPNRSTERRRRNKPVEGNETEIVDLTAMIAREVEIPVADQNWHPMAVRLWESLPKSGQCIHYEPSDWEIAYLICENISRELKPIFVGFKHVWNSEAEGFEDIPQMEKMPIKGGDLSAILKAFHVLMLTEGDRRRLRLELNRQGDGGEIKPPIPIGTAKAGLLG